MIVTIVRDDNVVIVDREAHTVDCSSLPADFHALQWDGQRGEIEYRALRCEHCGVRSKKGNEIISDLSQYQLYVDAWHAAKAAELEVSIAADRASAEVTNAAGPQN